MAIDVVVASKNDIVRSGLHRLLGAQEDMLVIGEAADFSSADRLVATLKPKIVVVELSVIMQKSIPSIEEVVHNWSGSEVIVFSLRRNREYVEHCLGAGARGFVLAELLGSDIVAAVRQVYGGALYLSPRLIPEARAAY